MTDKPKPSQPVQEYIAVVRQIQGETIKITPEMQKLADKIRDVKD